MTIPAGFGRDFPDRCRALRDGRRIVYRPPMEEADAPPVRDYLGKFRRLFPFLQPYRGRLPL